MPAAAHRLPTALTACLLSVAVVSSLAAALPSRGAPVKVRSKMRGARTSADLLPATAGNWWKYTRTSAVGKSQFKEFVSTSKPAPGGGLLVQLDTTGAKRENKSRFYITKNGGVSLMRVAYETLPALNNVYTPPKLTIADSVRPGSVWKWTGQCSRGGQETEQWQVFPRERVTVLAGSFECVKVSSLFRRGTLIVYTTLWYAPGVGIVKGTEGNGFEKSSFELDSYKVR